MYKVICIELENNELEPFAWTTKSLSKRQLRKLDRESRSNKNTTKTIAVNYRDIFTSRREMKQSVPQMPNSKIPL